MQIRIINIVAGIMVLAFAVFAYRWVDSFYDKNQKTDIKYITPNPELEKIITDLKHKNDSLIHVTNKRDTFIHEKIKYIKTKANAFNTISADSNVELFAKWNEELQDSCSRQRYFCIGACNMDCE